MQAERQSRAIAVAAAFVFVGRVHPPDDMKLSSYFMPSALAISNDSPRTHFRFPVSTR